MKKGEAMKGKRRTDGVRVIGNERRTEEKKKKKKMDGASDSWRKKRKMEEEGWSNRRREREREAVVELKREKVVALKHGSPRCCASCI